MNGPPAREQWIRRRESSLRARVVSRAEVIEPRLSVPFFLGEVLSDSIAHAVTLRGCSSTRPRDEFLTERQLEDAATPAIAHPRGPHSVFKERAAVTSGDKAAKRKASITPFGFCQLRERKFSKNSWRKWWRVLFDSDPFERK